MASQVESIKWVPGTRFMVDGFAFANEKCRRYFLTHCHSDHTLGLSRGFDAGTIFCSPVSAALLAAEKKLLPPVVQVLQLGLPVIIDGVTVTALDANHCPGAVMFLFEVPPGSSDGRSGGADQGRSGNPEQQEGRPTRILHTGDCRWRDELAAPLGDRQIDILILDTTYATRRFTFPPQQDAVAMMVQAVRDSLAEEPDTLFVVGSYHIGKERAFLGLAQALGIQIYASASKRKLLQLLDLPPAQLALVTDDRGAQLQVSPMVSDPQQLQTHLEAAGGRWKQVVGFRPTGWAYNRKGRLQVWREGAVACIGIPYSEHSSYPELRSCVARLRPRTLIPTVNADTKAASQRVVERFVDLMDLTGQRGRIDFYLAPRQQQQQQHSVGEQQQQHSAGEQQQHSVGEQQQQQQQQSQEEQQSQQQEDDQDQDPDEEQQQQQDEQIQRNQQQAQAAGAAASMDVSGTGSQDCCASGSCTEEATTASSSLLPLPVVVAAGGEPSLAPLPDESDGGDFDLAAVDLAEQQQLLEQVQRLQRLKRSVQLQAAARKKQRSRRTPVAKGSRRKNE